MGKKSHKYGLRTVALLEAIKGLAVVVLCFVLLSLLHKDLEVVVDHLTDWLRVNPDSRVADWLYDLADRTTGRGIWTAVGLGFAYATGRFVEAYGLWHERQWGEWFAVIAGAVYLPYEFYVTAFHPTLVHFAILLINVLVVLYILSILLENRRERAQMRAAQRSRDGAAGSAAQSSRR